MLASEHSDEDEMLDRVWGAWLERGHLHTSVDELAAATGVSPDLLFAKYGDMEQLFLRAFERHAERFVAQVRLVLDGRDVRKVVRDFVELTAWPQGNSSSMLSGLSRQVVFEISPDAYSVRRSVSDLLQTLETLLESRLDQSDARSRLKVAPELASKLVIAAARGVAVLARVQDHHAAYEWTTNALLDALFTN
jgi:AcrR family transcriptional regulator